MLLTEDSDNSVAQTSNPNNSEWCVDITPPLRTRCVHARCDCILSLKQTHHICVDFNVMSSLSAALCLLVVLAWPDLS